MEKLSPVLECCGVSHWFGTNNVLHEVDLKILRGEIVSLVGPSGCGKSTLLRAIIGTHPPCKGKVVVHNIDGSANTVTRPGRDRGIVYQRYTLYPFLTAKENVAFGLMLDQSSLAGRLFKYFNWRRLRKDHLQQAEELLVKLKLGAALNLYPHEMSGGMCQRVAIAQALIMKPEILLLDEPFGALDEATREELQQMLLSLYAENCLMQREGKEPPYTVLMVTHELNEAIYVSDRVVALSQYWDWQGVGHVVCPGATIVYDNLAPVFQPGDQRDYVAFETQRQTIRNAAFEPDILQDSQQFKQFWEDVMQGKGKGVLA